VDIELARQQWEDGSRRVEDARRDRRRYAMLLEQVELVTRELRKRVGQTFGLADLARAYDGADDWVRDVLDAAAPDAPLATEPGTVTDAAFHLYARGAADYSP